ncbi:MAG: hypothetical protein H0T46_32805 [Deltaproteobacteria bacterium]|nr:hypothetical protein [Deltaproteobacteria bacterium]
MSVRRLVSVLSVCLVASATVVVAQPKNGKQPVAPAKDTAPAPAPAPTPAAGSGSDAGSAVQMAEDPPPADMDGVNENPDAPRATGDGSNAVVVTVAPVMKKSGYPIEQSQRPITLPQNMSEVSIAPHAQISPYMGSDALRARYGITRQVQLGLTYLLGGIYDDPKTPPMVSDKIGFHPGKAVGLDVTVLLQDWLAVRLGVPVYIDPVAVGLQLGAPLKFILTDKLALGGMEDLLTFKVVKFAPTFYQEAQNASNAVGYMSNTTLSKGELRVSAFGEYQYRPKLVIIGKFGVALDDFDGAKATSFIRAGFNYTPRKYLDLGLSLGFDDLSVKGSFAPAGFLAVRI